MYCIVFCDYMTIHHCYFYNYYFIINVSSVRGIELILKLFDRYRKIN